jgi:ferredoxin/flavodoxin
MPNALIYVFTGTYHTLKAACMIQKHLEANNFATRIHEVRYPFENVPIPQDGDYVGFGYPVHAFNSPLMFLRFVRSLPAAKRNKAFIFKTSGEPAKLNVESSATLYSILRKKGYDVVLDTHMLMPYNILFRYPDGLTKQMTLYADALSRLLALRLLSGDRDTFKFSKIRRLISLIMRVEWFGAWLNGRLYSVNKKKCSGCMLCVKTCPTANITYEDGRFRFGGRCAMCMRCVMYCPKDAVNFGILRPLRVNGGYAFDKLLADPAVSPDYVGAKTKGYYKSFRGFFRRADDALAAYGLKVQGCTPQPRPNAPELDVFEAYEAAQQRANEELEEEENNSVI